MNSRFYFLILTSCLFSNDLVVIKPVQTFLIDCHEPSDLAFDSIDETFYCVSDAGKIVNYDINGSLIRSKKTDLRDIESIYIDKKFVYIIDERTRQILTLEKDTFIEVNRTIISYFGGANKGFEGITFNPIKNLWIVATEKSPVLFFELSSSFQTLNIIHEPDEINEVSGITYYNNFIWIINDGDRTLSKLDPVSYRIIDTWIVDIPTPEGLAFVKDQLFLVSDNYNMMYKMEKLK